MSSSRKTPSDSSQKSTGTLVQVGPTSRKGSNPIARSSLQTNDEDEDIVALMGMTGVGKSTFINLVSGSRLRVSQGLESCTDSIETSSPFVLDGRRVRLIDTPGFDDTTKSDVDILNLVANFFATEFQHGRKVAGIIYLHSIANPRVGGIARRNLVMFQKLCGINALKNVIIATTWWNGVDEAVGSAREDELRVKPTLFKPVLDQGAQLFRHDGSLGSAQALLRCLVGNTHVPLLIQTEIVDERKPISETAAGLELRKDITEQTERQEEEMRALLLEMEQVGREDEEGRKELEEEVQAIRGHMENLRAEAEKLSGGKALPMPPNPQRYPAETVSRIPDGRIVAMSGSQRTGSPLQDRRPPLPQGSYNAEVIVSTTEQTYPIPLPVQQPLVSSPVPATPKRRPRDQQPRVQQSDHFNENFMALMAETRAIRKDIEELKPAKERLQPAAASSSVTRTASKSDRIAQSIPSQPPEDSKERFMQVVTELRAVRKDIQVLKDHLDQAPTPATPDPFHRLENHQSRLESIERQLTKERSSLMSTWPENVLNGFRSVWRYFLGRA